MNKPVDLTALVAAIVEGQVKALETQIRSTATQKALEYITELFSKKRVSDGKGNGNFVTVAGPMLDFVHKKVEQLALNDETHKFIDTYVRENFQRVLQEELEIAIRDKARHEVRKGAFSHIPGAEAAPQRKSIHDPSPDIDVRASLGVNNSSCSYRKHYGVDCE